MRLMFATDLHLSVRPPSTRTEDYADHLFAKLQELQEIAAAEKIDLFIEGGDRFHWPRPDRTSHALVNRCIDIERQWPCPVRRTIGNHDLPPDYVGGYERTALSVLDNALNNDNMVMFEDERFVAKDGVTVTLSPANWTHDIDAKSDVVPNRDGWQYGAKVWKGVVSDFIVKIAHGLLMPEGSDPPFDVTTFDKVPQSPQAVDGETTDFGPIDVMLFGHPHWQTRIAVVNGCTFVGPGALARVNRSEQDHEPSYALINLTKGEAPVVEYRALTCVTPKDAAFIELVVPEEGEGLFAGYVGMLEARNAQVLDPEEALRTLEKNAEPVVVALVRGFLAEAGGQET